MSISSDGKQLTEESLLQQDSSLRVLSILVIVMLSVGLVVVTIEDWPENRYFAQIFGDQAELLAAFSILMVLTIGYLVGKGRATMRSQRILIDQLLEEEVVARARRLDPLTEFHHPEVCREILLRQCHYASRIHCAVSLVEITVPELGHLPLDPQRRPLVEELILEIKRLCRAMDFLVRWSPTSFLLVLPEVPREEAPVVTCRLRAKLERWSLWRLGNAGAFQMQWRFVTTEKLGASGDVLTEARRLFEENSLAPPPVPDGVQQSWVPQG